MAALDETIHQPTRLRLMAALQALPAEERVEFTRLRAILGVTDGNLGAHLTILETAGYVQIEKDFAGRKPRTRVSATPQGRRAFAGHLAFLRELLDAASRTGDGGGVSGPSGVSGGG